MSRHPEPPRLLESLDSEFAELELGLLAARAQAPNAEQLARMRAALGLPAQSAASEHVGPEPAGSPVSGSAVSIVPKLTIVGVLVLGGTLYFVNPFAHVERAAPQVVRTQPVAALPTPTAPVTPAVEAPTRAPQTVTAPAAPKPSAARGTRATLPAPPADHPVDSPPPAVDTRLPGGAQLLAELALLKRAKAHVRSAPERSLAYVDEHEQQFAAGSLVEEREVIAVEALLVAGREADGIARAERFFARFPQSAHARRVRALLAELTRGTNPR